MESKSTTFSFDALRDGATSMWNHGFAGITPGQVFASLIVLAIALTVRRLFGYITLRLIRFWSKHSSGAFGNALAEALTPPVRFIPIVIAVLIITAFLNVSPRVKVAFGELNRSLIAFVIFWALFQISGPALSTFDGHRSGFSQAMAGWAVRVIKIVLLCLGSAVVLEIWGIHVGPILAGLGLVGAAVALGAQDLFKNLIAGIFIIGEQRFENGDWIVVDGVVEGTVETIGLRATKVRRFDMAPVYVPNSKLADNAMTNFSQIACWRISWIIGLEYNTTVEQLRQIRDRIEAYILGSGDFAHPPESLALVRIEKFNESSIDLKVYCFTRTKVWSEWLEIKESLIFAIKEIVEHAGSGFAFPSRSLYVEAIPPGADASFGPRQLTPNGADPASASGSEP